MHEIELIEARIQDISVCMQMMENFYAIDHYPFDLNKAEDNFKIFVANKNLGRYFLVKQAEDIIGYIILSVGFSFEYHGKDSFIDEFYLLNEFRGLGIGQEVLKQVSIEAGRLGINAIHLEVENDNQRANQLYLKNGFKGNKRSLLTKRIEK